MLDHSKEALSLIEGRSRTNLDADRVLSLALVRLLEIVGEAAARVPIEERDRYAALPWTQIIGLRNRLIHGYDSIDFDILWNILSKDMPQLVSDLDAILED